MYPLVLVLAVDGIPVTVTCDLLGFSPQGFYSWRERPCSDRDSDDARLVDKIIDIHADDPEFGLPVHRPTSSNRRRNVFGEPGPSALPRAQHLVRYTSWTVNAGPPETICASR